MYLRRPQGSVLWPPLFAFYMSPVAYVSHSFKIHHQLHADDSQLIIALDSSNQTTGMTLNPDKSDAVLLGTRQHFRSCSHLSSVKVAGHSVSLSDNVRILGLPLDSHRSMYNHIRSVCKSGVYHIRSLRHIRSGITDYR